VSEDRDELLVAVVSLYYELDLNQQQIGNRFEISRSTVSRLIREARNRGIVDIRIHKSISRDFVLEQTLISRFGLKDVYVLQTTPDMDENALLVGVGRLAAGYIERVVASLPRNSCVGIAWGTGVHAAVSALSDNADLGIDVVQIMGTVGAPDTLTDGPDVARMLARRLGGRHYYLHAPALVEQPALREMLLAEPTIRDIIDRAQTVQLAIAGVGSVQDEAASFLRAGHLTSEDLAQLRAQGIVGESCGRFFDARGRDEGFEINQRIIGIELSALRRIPRVLAVARGLPKAESILGAMRGRFITVLATDDITARAVLRLGENEV